MKAICACSEAAGWEVGVVSLFGKPGDTIIGIYRQKEQA